jgi:hypothetical protein
MPKTRKSRKSVKGGSNIANIFEADTRSMIQYVHQRGNNLNFSKGANKDKLNAYKGQYRTFLTGVKDSSMQLGKAPRLVGGKTTRKQRGGLPILKDLIARSKGYNSLINPSNSGSSGKTTEPSGLRKAYNTTMRKVKSAASTASSAIKSKVPTFGSTGAKPVSVPAAATAATAAIPATPVLTREEDALRSAANAFAKNIADKKLSPQDTIITKRESYTSLSNALKEYLQSHVDKYPYVPSNNILGLGESGSANAAVTNAAVNNRAKEFNGLFSAAAPAPASTAVNNIDKELIGLFSAAAATAPAAAPTTAAAAPAPEPTAAPTTAAPAPNPFNPYNE